MEINELTPGDSAQSEVQGLNFTTTIESHLRWKARLADYIARKNEKVLDADVIALDNQCILGQWTYDIGGRKFGKKPGFYELIETHARFHQYAADVVRKVGAG